MVVDILNKLREDLGYSKEELIRGIKVVGTNTNNLAEYLSPYIQAEIWSDNGFQVDYTAIMMNEKDKRIAELEKALELACKHIENWSGGMYKLVTKLFQTKSKRLKQLQGESK